MLEVPRQKVLRQELVYAGAALVAGERPFRPAWSLAQPRCEHGGHRSPVGLSQPNHAIDWRKDQRDAWSFGLRQDAAQPEHSPALVLPGDFDGSEYAGRLCRKRVFHRGDAENTQFTTEARRHRENRGKDADEFVGIASSRGRGSRGHGVGRLRAALRGLGKSLRRGKILGDSSVEDCGAWYDDPKIGL